MMAPNKKFKSIHKNIGHPSGAAAGFKTPIKIIVEIKAKEILTIAGISLLDKTGASLIMPASLAKIIMPAPSALLISGNKSANCFKISSKIYSLISVYF